MEDCVFCKIAREELSHHLVYQDELVIAFLDRAPAAEGHTLIIPKKHYKDIYDIPTNTLERIIAVTKDLAIQYKKIFNKPACNTVNASGIEAQQSVFHYHMHLVPRDKDDSLFMWFLGRSEKQIAPPEVLEQTYKIILSNIYKGSGKT
ncbi:HIT family protein [Candidatus Woesearchaeota archaeon]|nr:HIT family protein [Candidatus Woesearchaeota archaeon]